MAQKAIYGLLVGIDKYPNPRHELKGCVNDVEAFKQYLEYRLDKDTFSDPELVLLKNEQATREAVIRQFQDHLGQAGPDDVALFYYSGHGGQENTPEEFKHLEPDLLNETLVCYDSRTESGWDLADKELTKLIADVAASKAHVLVILDCCHSGSGTREALQHDAPHETAVRRIPTDGRPRPLQSYLFWEQLRDLAANHDALENPWKLLPAGDHVLLAACEDRQLAKEYIADGKTWGTFSYFLRTTLEASQRSLSYRELIARVRARVESHKPDQRPLIEVLSDNALNQSFLSGAIADRVAYLAFFDKNSRKWMLDAGAVHGMQTPVGAETTQLALFDIDANAANLRDLSKAVANVTVGEVKPDRSVLELPAGAALDNGRQYQAVVTALPLPPLPVRLEGEVKGVDKARAALNFASGGTKPSLYVREEATHPRYRLIAKNNEYVIATSADDRPLVREIEGGYIDDNAQLAIANLEHIARWEQIAGLTNASSRIDPSSIEMRIDGEPAESSSRTLHYSYEGGRWQPPSFTLTLHNKGTERLYCALFNLSESFAVGSSLLPGGGMFLDPGQEITAYGGKPIPTGVPDVLWRQGVTERKDILKLVISSNAFDATLMQQQALEFARTHGAAQSSLRSLGGSLERLMKRVQTRELGDEAVPVYDDWITKQLVVTTVRPLNEVPVPQNGMGTTLGYGVTVMPHSSLKARVRLGTETEAGRDFTSGGLGRMVVPEIFTRNPETSQPFVFTQARGQDPGLSFLELNGVENHKDVTSEAPLELTFEVPLEKHEHVLPVAFDGEAFIPLGYSVPESSRGGEASKTRVVLQRLPDPQTLETKSLSGSIRILFQKVKSNLLGGEFKYPLLATAKVGEDGKVEYVKDAKKVKEEVQKAERILLFVHGIIGDTMGMAASVRLAKVMSAGRETLLKDAYDLVLTFDYENINTSIEDNALYLKERLESVGLGADHGKTLDVVAHSMGGLVLRWFIEREGGNKVVNHLVMLGTPNAGSPWPAIQDWATVALTFALNNLGAWPGSILGGLVNLIDKSGVALNQLNPGHDLIKELAKSSDPNVRYTVIAGDTSLLRDTAPAESRNLVQRLLDKLQLKQTFYTALNTLVFKAPNDIAVSVTSVKAVDMNRMPVPTVVTIDCDHITYFTAPKGLEALGDALP